MIKELQVTLYEVFGYVLPGGILTAALATVFLAIFFPMNVISFDLATTEVWITILALCYVSGHMGQAIANQVVKLWKWDEAKIVDQLPQEIREAVTGKLKEKLGDKAGSLTGRWMYELCDDAVVRSGKLGEREVYIYREGFYRGIFVGFGIMAIAMILLIVRLCCEPLHTFTVGTWAITPMQLLFFVLISAVFSYLALRRYWRFMDYRVRHSVLGFLTLSTQPADKGKDEKNGEAT